jgi:hypothetical protein
MGLNLDLTKRAPLEEAAREAFKDAFDTALIELADYLQRNSPRGVSSAGDSLAGGSNAGLYLWGCLPMPYRKPLLNVGQDAGGKRTIFSNRIR